MAQPDDSIDPGLLEPGQMAPASPTLGAAPTMVQSGATGLPPVQPTQAPVNILKAGTVIELPYHTNSSGQPIQIQLEQDVSETDLQNELDTRFPRTAQAVALQMMGKGAEPVSKEDYEFVKQQSKLMQQARGFRSEGEQSMLGAIADALPGAIVGVMEGAGATAKAGMQVVFPTGEMMPDANLRQRFVAAGTALEGLIQGTERLGGIASMLGSLAIADEYGAYKSLKNYERTELERQAGNTAILPLNPEAAKEANKVSQFLDATVLLPIAGKLVGSAGRVATEQAVKELAKQSSVGMLRKGLGTAMEVPGALVTQLIDLGAEVAAERAGKETILGSFAKGTGGVLKLKPQAVEWAGKLLKSEAVSETLAQGIRAAQAAGRSGAMLRAVAKITPPDSVMRAAGSVFDSMLNGAALGAGISGVQAAADPFNTKGDVVKQMVVGGATGGALGTFFGVIPGAAELTPTARNMRFVTEMAKDISERPETRSFVFDGAEYATNDATNRVKLLNNDNMSATEKARIFAVTKSAEYAGHDVGYIDNSTVLPERLGGIGENIRGVKTVSDNGRTTLLINVDQINPASAVEEVAHAFIGREAGREIINDLIKNRGGVSQALEPLVDLGRRYLTALQETSPEAAAQFGKHLAVAEDVNQPPAARQTAAILLAEEWAAMGVGEILSGADPKILETGRGTVSIWDSMRKGLVDTFAGLMTQPSAASKDPITGFFYKDGRLIKDPVLEATAKRLQDSILRGQNFFPQDFLQPPGRQRAQQATAAAVGVNVGDTMVNGAQVIDIIPRPRYEDTHAQDQESGAKAGSATKPNTTRKETGQDTYHKFVFDQVAQVAGESVVDPGLVQSGVYFGNLTKVPAGSPIVYTKAFTEPQLQQLFQVQTHHNRPLIAPEARDAVARFNEASKNSQLVVVDYDMNIGKAKTGREYTGRVQQVVLPLGMQQTPKGGPIAGVFNMSLLNDIVNYQRSLKGMEKVDAAFRDFGIKSLEDLIPVVKAHVENYSSPNAVPGVTLLQGLRPGVSKESATVLRDLMHISNGLSLRKAFPSDVLVNPQQFQGMTPAPERQVTAYDITGKPRAGARVYRDRAVFSDLRLDSLHNVQLYAGRDGLPVKVDVNLEQFVPKQRSNFSPRRSINEQIGETQVVTDQDTGRRAFILKDGRAKVFNPDGSLKGVYDSLLDAQIALNKAASRQARGIESRLPQLEQVTLSQREQFMRDAMEAERGIAAQALARISSRQGQGNPSVLRTAAAGQLSKAEMARMAAAIERKAAQDYPVLDPDEVRTLFRERRRRPEAEPETADIRFSPRSPAAVRRAAEDAQARANIEEILVNAAQKAFKRPIEDAQARENIQETLANAARKASKRAAEDRQARKNIQEILANSAAQKAAKRAPEDAQARTNIEEILANAGKKAFKREIENAQARENIQEILANAAQKAFKRPIENAQARANLQEILRAVAEKAAKQPKREPVVIDVPKAEIPKIEPPVEPIVTPAEEPRLPSNMIIARAPRGMFKLYSLTQQGKAVQEALSESYGDALQKAQRKYFLKNKMKEDQAFLKSQRYATQKIHLR